MTILKRTLFLMLVFGVLAFVPLLWKLWQIQIVEGDKYQEMAIDQQTSDLAITAPRGTIYDSQGNILAISASVQNVIISPREIKSGSEEAKERAEKKLEKAAGLSETEKEKKGLTLTAAEQAALNGTYQDFIADGLSSILSVDKEKILERMAKDNRYQVIARRVEDELSSQVNTFISENGLYPGVYLRPDTKRYYPYSSLGAQVIGWVNPNNENKGAYGLEARYDSSLTGTPGRVITAITAQGVEMLNGYENYIDFQSGYDYHLTLNATIQGYCERALSEGIASYEVRKGGFCIAMDPNTGAILGLASSPWYDLNNPWGVTDPILSAYLETVQNDPAATEDAYREALASVQLQQWRNKALSDAYEPGSTFKTLVLGAALEEGVVSESDHFYCTGVKEVADWKIKCSRTEGHGDQTLAKAVANSCNPAFIEIGQKLGAEKFYDYLEAYGFFDKTGLDPQVEGKAQIWERDYFTSEYGVASLAAASFGQTLKVTPIQMITAACAAVNGGHLMEPYLVESVVDSSGAVVESHQPVEVRQVISEETSQRVRTMLEGVVDGGTGKNAYMAGYRIGGKTGTSEKRDEDTGDLIVSFLGVAPADDPQVVILLAFDSPTPVQKGSDFTSHGFYISGGQMAALSAGPLIADILDYLGVERVYAEGEMVDTLMPSTVGLSQADAQRTVADAGFTCRLVGEGAVVTDQIPTQGVTLPKGSEVILYLGQSKPTEQVEVPDLTGSTLAQAQQRLAGMGLYLRAEGITDRDSTAQATGQSVTAGAMVDPGTVVEVHFMDANVRDFVAQGTVGQNVN